MTNSPEIPVFDPALFDEQFFASYDQQLASLAPEDRAPALLKGVLTIKNADGSEKSYEQLVQDTVNMFSDPWVQTNEALLNVLSEQFALSCMGHDHGSELARDSQLSEYFDRGVSQLFDEGNSRGNEGHGKNKQERKSRRKSKTVGSYSLSLFQKRVPSQPKKPKLAPIIRLRPSSSSEKQAA